MPNTRDILLDWVERGLIEPDNLKQAMIVTGVLPSKARWREFLERLLLWMGVLLVAAGLIFFLAYNWKDLGGFVRFGLAEAMVVLSLGFVWRLGLDRPGGKAALVSAALALGALLAVIGQTYQTGADTFQLFLTWAVMILPWVIVGRFAVLWILWLALLNVASMLYLQIFPNVFGLLFGRGGMPWVLLALNISALAAWEAAAIQGVEWLRPRWAPRLIAAMSCSSATALAIDQMSVRGGTDIWGFLAWLGWLFTAWAVYRTIIKDVFVLACGALSLIVVMAYFAVRYLPQSSASGFFYVGVLIITLSGVAGWWLKHVAEEER